jgi:dTMP kinase
MSQSPTPEHDVDLDDPIAPTREPGFATLATPTAPLVDGQGPVDISQFPGKLITLEGTDGVGRSTHCALLREWLETAGYGVLHTGLKHSRLAGDGLRRAKEGHTLGQITMDLFYATDFADRLEQQVIPALRAGFIVLTDRYIYSTMARSIVRGADPAWITDVFRFAPKPHAVFYLRVDLDHLLPRVLSSGGFDYWESGMDFQEETDRYRSFTRYQGRLLSVFDELSATHGFRELDARGSVEQVFAGLRGGVSEVLNQMEGATA